MEHIQVVVLKNSDLFKVFSSLQETHRFLKELAPSYNVKNLYDVINQGIDDFEKWTYNDDVYEFKTTKETREKRQNRKTR